MTCRRQLKLVIVHKSRAQFFTLSARRRSARSRACCCRLLPVDSGIDLVVVIHLQLWQKAMHGRQQQQRTSVGVCSGRMIVPRNENRIDFSGLPSSLQKAVMNL